MARAGTTKKTTVKKIATKKTASAKASPPGAPEESVGAGAAVGGDIQAADSISASNPSELKLRALVDLVASRSGVKKKDVKPVIDAALAILGEAIAEKRELNLPPLGKLKVNRTKDTANGRIIVCKLRQRTAVRIAPPDPIADAAE